MQTQEGAKKGHDKKTAAQAPAKMESQMKGYEMDITDTRYHHEIYLSDPRKCDVSRLKTVVRHPIRKAE